MADSTGHQFTHGGNLKAPTRALLCEWIKACWEKISSETIQASFKSCAVTTATGGIEDDINHCFKEGQPCADGKLMLAEKSCQLLRRLEDSDDDTDPFEDAIEDEEAECNEARIDEDSELTSSDSDNSA